MTILPKAIYIFNAIPIQKKQKNPNTILQRLGKNSSQIHLEKKSKRVKTILNNKRKARGITILDLKLYYRALVIKKKKLPSVGTETDTLINGIELKTQK